MKNKEKFHSFWKNDLNPITMRPNRDNILHVDNMSREETVALERKRQESVEIREIMERIKEQQDD